AHGEEQADRKRSDVQGVGQEQARRRGQERRPQAVTPDRPGQRYGVPGPAQALRELPGWWPRATWRGTGEDRRSGNPATLGIHRTAPFVLPVKSCLMVALRPTWQQTATYN